jgi:excisionase family DNA binding protein
MATEQAFEELIRRGTPVSAPPGEHAEVVALSALLGRLAHAHKRCELIGPQGKRVQLPESVFYVLERVAKVLADGDAVTVVPVGKELTTQRAADLLNVSRQYLVRLLDAGQLPYTRTGKHRRLRVEDVLAFKEKRDQERKAALDRLTELSEELGGYDELK